MRQAVVQARRGVVQASCVQKNSPAKNISQVETPVLIAVNRTLWADLVWKRNNIEQHKERKKERKKKTCLHEGEEDEYQDKGEEWGKDKDKGEEWGKDKDKGEEWGKVEGEELECVVALKEGPELGLTDQIRATIIDHVINHGLSYREDGERVQPNLSRDTVASIVRIFRETNRIQRLPPLGGRGKLLNEEQELAIVNMVIADNEIKLKDIQSRVVEDNLRVMELEANQVPHEIIYVDESGFNLAKRRRRGRNIIGQRATVTVPGQRGANITMCTAISNNVTAWFDAHPRMMSHFLAPYSPFLNPIEEFFSAWRWKVFDHRPHDQMSLLDAMDAACQDITAEHCQGWIRHAKRFFPRCLAKEDIRCDVDENMWPNAQDRAE
ncbi:Ribosome maturation factor RimP [Labeo rohita]|uniref:Ribosome maturation factor RimP n=1 Tax=Labeo rohita TaxID=84645 RepID=A0ABQ8MF72_LABRO|nr:Ribosome maturation factor RimP [Labeo rohita]